MATALAAVAAGTLPGASASGEATVTVRGIDFPDLAKTRLNVVGCASVFSRSGQAPRAAIGVVPGSPAGKRSLALTAAAGDAVGPVSYVSSLAATPSATMAVRAERSMTGVGYVGYQAPADVGSNRMWVGRAELPVAADTWTDVSLAGASLSWIQYDMGTRQPLAGPVAATSVAAFTASQGGDGYGFYALGFGCEGSEFNTDAWRIGSTGGTTTYDFEGYAATVTGGGDTTIAPGESVTLTAQVGSDGPAPRLVLEQLDADGDWGAARTQPRPGATSVTVTPEDTTTYRWKIYSTPMVEAVKDRSQDRTTAFTVTVAEPDPAPDADAPAQQPDRQRDKAPDKQAPHAPASTPAEPAAPAAPAAQPADAATPATPAATPETSSESPATETPAPESSTPATPESSPEPPGVAETPAG